MSALLLQRTATLTLGAATLPDGRPVSAATRKAVFRELAWAADDHGEVPPHRTIHRHLAAALELHTASIERALATLVAEGWLYHAPGPSRRPGAYWLNLERMAVENPPEAGSGARLGRAPVRAVGAHEKEASARTVPAVGAHRARPRRADLYLDIDLGADAPSEVGAPMPARITEEAQAAAASGIAQWREALRTGRRGEALEPEPGEPGEPEPDALEVLEVLEAEADRWGPAALMTAPRRREASG